MELGFDVEAVGVGGVGGEGVGSSDERQCSHFSQLK